MLRKQENPDKFKAAVLAALVHLVLLGGLLISFNWKAAHQVLNVTEVDLWDKLPAPKAAPKPPEPKPVIEEKPEPKPEPKPVVEEKPKPEQPKVDIALEKKKQQEEAKRLEEEKLKAQKLAEQKKKEQHEKLLQAMRDEELSREKPKDDDALKKLQAEIEGEHADHGSAASSAATAKQVDKYIDKLKDKIRGHIFSNACSGNPIVNVQIGLLPTGQLKGGVRITKHSENPACDAAVEHAILASEPFELPEDNKLKAEFRELNLTIKPND